MYNIKVARGNVVNAATEAIVSPANNNLMPGQGISKMVFYSAGSKLIEACSKLKYCDTGLVAVTSGYNLTAPYIIHAVGPFWHGGYVNEAEDLASMYISIMRAVRKLNIKSVAIPALCTGIAKYPLEEAVDIAISSVVSYLQSHNMDTEVLFMCYDVDTLYCYRNKINEGVPDITKYFNRKEISINAKLNDKESKLLKKKLFQKNISPENEKEAVRSVIKRIIKKKYPDCVLLLSRKNDAVSMKIVDKLQKSGPFITADSIKSIEHANGRMKIKLEPFCFINTPEEIEAKKEFFDNDNNGMMDIFQNGVAPSYQERQKITVVNVESLLGGDKQENNNKVISPLINFSELETTQSVEKLVSPIEPVSTTSSEDDKDTMSAETEPSINNEDNYDVELSEELSNHKKRNKSKYWPNFKPDYKSREYQKKIHSQTK